MNVCLCNVTAAVDEFITQVGVCTHTHNANTANTLHDLITRRTPSGYFVVI